MSGLRLTIELVPRTSWYSNLRKTMSPSDWDRVRKATYARFGHKCAICESTEKPLNCHEIWQYDDARHVQSLSGFTALCPMCHHVKHIGLARILANEGQLDFEKVVEHFLKVNQCDKAGFDKHCGEAFATWQKRSEHDWVIDLGEYAPLIKSRA